MEVEMMKYYGKVSGEGFGLILAVAVAAMLCICLIAASPLFLIGLVKRVLVAAIKGGDPLVP